MKLTGEEVIKQLSDINCKCYCDSCNVQVIAKVTCKSKSEVGNSFTEGYKSSSNGSFSTLGSIAGGLIGGNNGKFISGIASLLSGVIGGAISATKDYISNNSEDLFEFKCPTCGKTIKTLDYEGMRKLCYRLD